MTQYEVGAKSDGADVPTKKALKELIKKNPSAVSFYPVTLFPNPASESLRTTADKFPRGIIGQVTGPNPYTSRKWFATLAYNRKGELVAR
jgi:hypothetical protein